jgi:hypothetical protein
MSESEVGGGSKNSWEENSNVNGKGEEIEDKGKTNEESVSSEATDYDICFCVDATGSMSSMIAAAQNKVISIASELQHNQPNVNFKFGAIFYRDPVDAPSDVSSFHELTDNVINLRAKIMGEKATGGGDTPEDWVGCYRILFEKLSWREGSVRIIFHIADAPAHGREWGGNCNHQKEGEKLTPLIHRLAKDGYFFNGICMGSAPKPSFDGIKRIYVENGKGRNFRVQDFDSSSTASTAGDFLSKFVVSVVAKISGVADFMENYEEIEKAMLSAPAGDTSIRAEMVKMQARLVSSIKKSEMTKETCDQFEAAVESGDIDTGLKVGRQFFSKMNTEFEQRINKLIRLCDGGIGLLFGDEEIKSFRATIASDAEEIQAVEVEDTASLVGATFSCPISYEDETDPVILIVKPSEPILMSLDKRDTEFIINCPLSIFRMQKLLDLFIQCIDHPISLKSMRDAEAHGIPITHSPLTRREIIGAIPLGASKSHISAANWSPSQIVSGGKVLGRSDFWFAVLWLLIQSGKIPFLNDIEKFAREQMLYRLTKHHGYASLTGLSMFPGQRLRLANCCWFCLATPFFIPAVPNSKIFSDITLLMQMK